jgi:hypothetical protein
VTYSKSGRAISFVALFPVLLMGQRTQDAAVPLKNWPTAQYWQPSQAEREAAAKSSPQLQFSTNAVSNTALIFVAITPCRLVDTRGASAGFNGIAPFSGPSISAGATLTIPVQSTTESTTNTEPAPCGVIPTIAQAYSFNLTVVPTAGGAVDYVSLWPSNYERPYVSTLDDPQGAIVSNAAIVPAGNPTGGINVFNFGPATTDVIIDMNGYFAAPTDVNSNTAIGTGTLANNTTGSYNTASGAYALESNTTGGSNTASGASALQSNTTGSNNTASGYGALDANTTGNANTATGINALGSNTTGGANTASGAFALMSNTTGGSNTAIGASALQNSTTGGGNMASGEAALLEDTTGGNNTASGTYALQNNTTGSNNIAVGFYAAGDVGGGNSNNIDIGTQGVSTDGATANSGVIRIGTPGTQTSAYIAGISGASVAGGAAVYVTGTGQLGTVLSSRRFKEQITDMGDSSSKLFELRPVNFFYKPRYDDGSHALQYGLIAEEVAKVYPEMVAYDKDGQILTVKYQMLAPMLVNELQKQVQLQQEENRKLEDRLAALEALLAGRTSTAAPPAGNH